MLLLCKFYYIYLWLMNNSLPHVYYPPQYVDPTYHKQLLSVFLAGSIEMWIAPDRQQNLIDKFAGQNIVFFNPRRLAWDATWDQDISNNEFRTQVERELDHLEQADLVVMYLDPTTKAPISLLELWLSASSKHIIVCCPEWYYKKWNVDIVCQKYNIEQVATLEELIQKIRTMI